MNEDIASLDLLARQSAVDALELFRDLIVEERGRIENETEPVFDVIVDLLNRTVDRISSKTNGRLS